MSWCVDANYLTLESGKVRKTLTFMFELYVVPFYIKFISYKT